MSTQPHERTASGLIERARAGLPGSHPRRTVTVSVAPDGPDVRYQFTGGKRALRTRAARGHPLAVRQDGAPADPNEHPAYEIRTTTRGIEVAPVELFVPDEARPRVALRGCRTGVLLGVPLAGSAAGAVHILQITGEAPGDNTTVLVVAVVLFVLTTLLALGMVARKGPEAFAALRPGFNGRPRPSRAGRGMAGRFIGPDTRSMCLEPRPESFSAHDPAQLYATHALAALAAIKDNAAWWSDHLDDSRSVLDVDVEAGHLARYTLMLMELDDENGTRPELLSESARRVWEHRRQALDRGVDALRERAAGLTALMELVEDIRRRSREADLLVNARADELADRVVAAVDGSSGCPVSGSTTDICEMADEVGGSLAEDTALVEDVVLHLVAAPICVD